MTITLIAVFCLYIALKVLSIAAQKARERRLAEAQRKTQAEQKLLRDDFRAQQAEAREAMQRQLVLEREQIRLAKEQEKQAAILEKHEKRIEALEYKVRQLDRNIEAQNELLADYYAQLDWLLLQQSGTVPGGKQFTAWQNKIVTKNNQIRKAENKIADMKDAKAMAERELAA